MPSDVSYESMRWIAWEILEVLYKNFQLSWCRAECRLKWLHLEICASSSSTLADTKIDFILHRDRVISSLFHPFHFTACTPRIRRKARERVDDIPRASGSPPTRNSALLALVSVRKSHVHLHSFCDETVECEYLMVCAKPPPSSKYTGAHAGHANNECSASFTTLLCGRALMEMSASSSG